jgi:hypothetical protein
MNRIEQTPRRQTVRRFFMLTMLMFMLPFQIALASINTGLNGDDYVTGKLPIGFEFQFYDQTFTQFYVSTNGLLQFEGPTTAYSNSCLPRLKNTLFVFWDDLRTNVNGQPNGLIQYETQGEAPNRRLIVQWTNQYFYSSNLPMGTFQAILYETTGEIKFQYRYLLDARSLGNSATIGIGGPSSQAVQIGCNKANAIAPEQAILFTPNGEGTYRVDEQADYQFIDISGLTPAMPKTERYTNTAPKWQWDKVASLSLYEIEIRDPAGQVLLSQTVGDVNSFTYDEGFQQGKSYMARIRGSINNGGTWEMWSELSTLTTVDTIAPIASIQGFQRNGETSAIVSYRVTDELSGIKSARLQISTDRDFSQFVEFNIEKLSGNYQANGLAKSDALFARLQTVDKAGNISDYSNVVAMLFHPPRLITPVEGATIKRSPINVVAKTVPNGDVQVYVDDQAVGSRQRADAHGNVTVSLPLTKEGTRTIAVDVETPYAVSEKSVPATVNYQLPVPKGTFVSPAENSTVSAPINIEVSATDELGIERIEFYLDGQSLAVATQAPYRMTLSTDGLSEGQHLIKAVIVNTSGKRSVIERNIVANIVPPQPVTPYSGQINSVTPALSYGNEAVNISGRAVNRTGGEAMANSELTLVLTVDGFKRQISVVSDDQGLFNYRFVPQSGDRGIYRIAAIHPKEKDSSATAEFTIDRIKFSRAHYPLLAAKNIATRIETSASAAADTQGIRWVIRAEDQPSGKLPQGIKIDGGNGIDIQAGKSAALMATFTADDTAAPLGTVILTALSNTSGEMVRGHLQVNYRLTEAKSSLYTKTPVIETGVKQGDSVIEEIVIGNKGLISAENVSVKLVDDQGKQPPAWVFIAGNERQGALNVGEFTVLQLTAQPDSRVSDGIYRFTVQISTDNGYGGTIPVSVSVLQSGEGAVRFDVADIYTATLDKNGLPIPGLKGAKIKLQNETVPTDVHTVITDGEGIGQINALSPGIYLYRISASQHNDISGRIRVKPGVTSNQHIFLDYQTVSIEFSVTETTIKDVYDIELEATYNTQVPAPVVVFEPLSINLSGMLVGEQKMGQLTLTNYGLVQADGVNFTLPQSDELFKFEFFGEVPDVILPKTRITIPYRVTALKASGGSGRSLADVAQTQSFPMLARATRSGQCSSYIKDYAVNYSYKCANDETTNGGGKGHFYVVTGSGCGSSGGGGGGGWPAGGSGGGFGGSGGSASFIPMAPQCSKDCSSGQCCKPEGEQSASQ